MNGEQTTRQKSPAWHHVPMETHRSTSDQGHRSRSGERVLFSRALVWDTALGFLALVLFVLPINLGLEPSGPPAIFLAATAIAVRRVSPPIALGLIVGLLAVQSLGLERPGLVDVAVIVVLVTAAAVGTRAELGASAVLAVGGGVGATVYLAHTGFRYADLLRGPLEQAIPVAAAPTVLLAVAWLIGFTLRSRSAELHASAQRFTAEQNAVRAGDDAAAERVRGAIARDVHDVVGHSLAVIITQADSVAYLDDFDQVRDVSATIAETARASLLEVRQVLRPAVSKAGPVAPGRGDLDEVVRRVREAGVSIELETRGATRPLPTDVAMVARRVLQEMLTNAMRHGQPGGHVRVTISWRAADVVLETENPLPQPALFTEDSGQGIAGMRERLAAIGGLLDAATIDDVFIIRALIPTRGEAPSEEVA